MGLFRFKKPIKPTERGLAFVRTDAVPSTAAACGAPRC